MRNPSTCLAWDMDNPDEARAQQLMEELGTARKKFVILIYKTMFPEWYRDKTISVTLQAFLSRHKKPYSTPPPSRQPTFINWTSTTAADRMTYELFTMLQGGIKDATVDLLKQIFPMWFSGSAPVPVQDPINPVPPPATTTPRPEPVTTVQSETSPAPDPDDTEDDFDFPDPDDAFN